MIHDYDKVHALLVEAINRNNAASPNRPPRNAARTADSIIDLGCELLLNGGASPEGANRFTSAFIHHAAPNGQPLSLLDLTSHFLQKAVNTFERTQDSVADANIIMIRSLTKIGAVVLGAPASAISATSAQIGGTVQNAPQQGAGRGMGQGQQQAASTP